MVPLGALPLSTVPLGGRGGCKVQVASLTWLHSGLAGGHELSRAVGWGPWSPAWPCPVAKGQSHLLRLFPWARGPGAQPSPPRQGRPAPHPASHPAPASSGSGLWSRAGRVSCGVRLGVRGLTDPHPHVTHTLASGLGVQLRREGGAGRCSWCRVWKGACEGLESTVHTNSQAGRDSSRTCERAALSGGHVLPGVHSTLDARALGRGCSAWSSVAYV